ncbi:MAG TPA: restriction endonuclease subunit S [Bacteroidales bacterium]|nr:restriction endonuclease subunit S [Bacteroidales bacterium]
MTVDDYFTIQYGQREYHSKSHLKRGKTPLISSSGVNNGVYGFYNTKPKFKNVISFPSTGSIGEARVHDYSCCIDDNCLVLVPNTEMSIQQLFYVASVIQNQKWRFKYGRQATEERIKNISLPLLDKINERWTVPDIEINNIIPDYRQLFLNLDGKKLDDMFIVSKGVGVYFEKCKVGKTPMISASEMNNGVIGFVDQLPSFKAPCITIERIHAKAHVQTTDFITVPDDVFVLIPKYHLTTDIPQVRQEAIL